MSDWRPIDQILGDWGDHAPEPLERLLLSRSEAEARFLRRKEREQEEERASRERDGKR
jgi:hypothetical protein